MAGRGSRLRPHTLTTPKPLLPIAGKPIVQRLVEDLAASCTQAIDEVAFIIGDFGTQVEKDLHNIAASIGAKASIYHQLEPLGTGHAILQAAPSLTGHCIIAFADTLFKATFSFDPEADSLIWVQQVADPSAFGVVKLDKEGYITDFVEKPREFVSDLAIVGIYYFKDGDALRTELESIIELDIRDKGEFQLTTALEHLKKKGTRFKPQTIEEWLDCGNKNAVLHTNKRILTIYQDSLQPGSMLQNDNSLIIPPCFIGNNVVLRNAVVGPYVSIGDNTIIEKAVISNTIIQSDAQICSAIMENAMVGNQSSFAGSISEVSVGDYCEIKEGSKN